MNIEALREELELRRAIEADTARFQDMQTQAIAELETQLAEAENPKLRHGDLRECPGNIGICIVDTSEPHGHLIWADKHKRTALTREAGVIHDSKSIGNLKDIFDDLTALREPLKQFKTEYGGETTEWSLSPQCKDLIFITDKKTWIVKHQDIPKLILNLRRLVHTAGLEGSHE